MTRYKAALIGLGRIASTIDDEVQGRSGVLLPYSHMACYRDVPEIDVVAAADPYPQQREAFRERWGVERLYEDYREMLDREQLDVVSVTTSARPRPQIVIDCATSGVSMVFAEKPISFSLKEADDMLDACAEHGTKLAIGCTRRWDAYWNMVRALIDAGEIGRVLQVNGYVRAGLSHNGSHLIDLVRYLAGGNVNWVFGEMESDEKATGDDDLMGNGYLAFDNGVRAFIRTWPTGGAEWDVDIIGETGRFRSQGATPQETEWWQTNPEGTRRDMVRRLFPRPQRLQSPGVRAVHDMIRCLESDHQPTCSGDDGRAALETALALRESHRRGGCRVNLPLPDRDLLIRSAETLHGDLPRALAKA